MSTDKKTKPANGMLMMIALATGAVLGILADRNRATIGKTMKDLSDKAVDGIESLVATASNDADNRRKAA